MKIEFLQKLMSSMGKGNAVISPYSISSVFSLLAGKSNTYRQIASVMGENRVIGVQKDFKFKTANSIWAKERISKQFIKGFNGWANKPRFDQMDKSGKPINDWVSRNTEGLITELVPDEIPEEILVYLINAVYFLGEWQCAFKEDKTISHEFDERLGFGMIDAPHTCMMMLRDHAKELYYEDEKAHYLALPYKVSSEDGVEPYMVLALPKDNKLLLSEFWKTYNPLDWKYEIKEITCLGVPRFKLSFTHLLAKILYSLGIEDIFTEKSDISIFENEQKLIASEVLQKVFIENSEKGTEAAAATYTGISGFSGFAIPQFYLVFDRPFAFAIVDKATQNILFSGSIERP